MEILLRGIFLNEFRLLERCEWLLFAACRGASATRDALFLGRGIYTKKGPRNSWLFGLLK